MKCFVVFSFCVATAIGAYVRPNIGSTTSLTSRSNIIRARGVDGKSPKSAPSPAHGPSLPARNTSPRNRSPNNSPSRKSKSSSPVPEENIEPPRDGARKSPRLSIDSRPQSPQENLVVSPSRNRDREVPSPSRGNREPLAAEAATLPTPPSRIRTNPMHQSQQRRPEHAQPGTAASQARPRPVDNPLRARLQQIQQDPRTTKAGADIVDGQGSVMTSRLPDRGESILTADHVLGTHARFVTSKYHTSVMATNNLAAGRVSAQTSADSLVKGGITSLDPAGRGIIRAQVPGRAEMKTTIEGIGNVALEAANHAPGNGHASLQAEFKGHGWVEAQGHHSNLRPDVLADPRMAALRPSNPAPPPQQMMRQNSATSGPDSSQRQQPRRSGRQRGKTPEQKASDPE